MDQLDRLERLTRLRDEGALSQAEFEEQKARLLARATGRESTRRALWISVSLALAVMAAALLLRQWAAAPAVDRNTDPTLAAPKATRANRNEAAATLSDGPAACLAPACRTLSPEGWGQISVGLPVERALAAAGLRIRRPGHYDQAFADEPDRLRPCNIFGVVGAPENLSVFVENGILTSVGVGLPSESENGGEVFETDRGVRLGDPESAVRRAYPRLEEEPDIYSEPPDKKLFFRGPNGLGIKFSIVGGRVSAIAAGQGSINYVEGCL